MRYPIGYVRPCNRHRLSPAERAYWARWDAENGVTERHAGAHRPKGWISL